MNNYAKELAALLSHRKEIFFLTQPEQIGQNVFIHVLYFFMVLKDQLFNISPLVAGAAGLKVVESNRITQKGAGNWPLQLVEELKKKLNDTELKVLSLAEAEPTAEVRLTLPMRVLPPVEEPAPEELDDIPY